MAVGIERTCSGGRLAARCFRPTGPGLHLDRVYDSGVDPRRHPARLRREMLRCVARAVQHVPRGTGREGARSEERAEQRLAPGGGAPAPETVQFTRTSIDWA